MRIRKFLCRIGIHQRSNRVVLFYGKEFDECVYCGRLLERKRRK